MFEYIIIGAIIGGIAYYLFKDKIKSNKQIPMNDVKNKIEYFKTDISDKFKKFISKLTLPTAINYMLHAKNNDVIIGDGINTNKQYLIINPICSNIEFLKNFKDIDAELKKKLNEVINENNKLKSEMEYKTLLDANKIYTEHPILTLFEKSDNNAKNNGGGK